MPRLAVRVERVVAPSATGMVGRRSRIAQGYYLELLSPRELSYHGHQLGVDAPEVIYPLGWGQWGAINPGEDLPFGWHLAPATDA